MEYNVGEILKKVNEQYKIREQNFEIGDTVKVFVKIIEGKRERIQAFQGTVISIRGSGSEKTFKVRKVSGSFGIERTFPLHSRIIQKIEVVKTGKCRRAKLFYLRDRIGKSAQLKPSRRKRKIKK